MFCFSRLSIFISFMAMSHLLSLSFLIFLNPTPTAAEAQGAPSDSFIRECQPSRCGRDGPLIRFPFRLDSHHPPYCGLAGFNLSCSGPGDTLLSLPFAEQPFVVSKVDYRERIVTINGPDSWVPCPLQSYLSLNLFNSSNFGVFSSRRSTLGFKLVSCSKEAGSMDGSDLVGPIDCLGSGDRDVFVIDGSVSMDKSKACEVNSTVEIVNGGPFVIKTEIRDGRFVSDERERRLRVLSNLLERRQFALVWRAPVIGDRCDICENEKMNCGFNATTNHTFCFSSHVRGVDVGLIVGTSIGSAIALAFVLLLLLYIYKRSQREKETRVKVEKFLASYKTLNPSRYTYSDIRKMTKQFKHRIGQGGFGSVYKGELSKGIPIAVKMVETTKGNGEEFVNEVATIGRIHHTNVVRLLGFCSEGPKRALIYEFMPNGSLDKFIFSKETPRGKRLLSQEMLYEIAVGIARGIEYLHHGCNLRILHFDIKPHNILLDDKFRPRISDFGLSKLCSKDQSYVSMTAARGTTGYMAPELFSRNFGMVSYKSDVYSYGMLLLEMIDGRKNADGDAKNSSQIHFPEWAYNQLIRGKELGVGEKTGVGGEIPTKLTIVSLWCIQWNPSDRPSMKEVVQMLEGDLSSLQIPPKPFVSTTGS